MLETLPLQSPAENITQVISETASQFSKSFLSSLIEISKPFLALIGGLLGFYILYKIIQAVSSYILRKRISRIEKEVLRLNEKTDEILSILKKSKNKEKKK